MYFSTAFLALLSTVVYADELIVKLPHLSIDPANRERVLNGAKFFAQKCQSCHSMTYLRYDEISNQAGVKYGLSPSWSAGAWKGRPPPDLSLVAITKGPDWVYGYLKSYYKTDHGYQNLVNPNTQMPNPYPILQGNQVLTMPFENIKKETPRLFRALRLEKPGSIPAHDFNDKVLDLMHYLVYAADPSVAERKSLAPYILVFLLLLSSGTFLLYKSYKKEVDK